MGWMGWQGWPGCIGRGPTPYVSVGSETPQVLDDLVESYVVLEGAACILGRLRGRCWGGGVDHNRLIFRRPFGWRIADARAHNVVHANATILHTLRLNLAGGSGVEVAVKPPLVVGFKAVVVGKIEVCRIHNILVDGGRCIQRQALLHK